MNTDLPLPAMHGVIPFLSLGFLLRKWVTLGAICSISICIIIVSGFMFLVVGRDYDHKSLIHEVGMLILISVFM